LDYNFCNDRNKGIKKMTALTLYYDGRCLFCLRAMDKLRRWDKAGHLAFVDIAGPDFDPAPLGVSLADLNRTVHARRADGALLTGIDTILAAYTLVGRGWRVWPLRWRWLRRASSAAYASLAHHRYRLSRWLGLRPPRCDGDVCALRDSLLRMGERA
jgi:predicted DCC family thiol-disulfide oxidoreductase YuxK